MKNVEIKNFFNKEKTQGISTNNESNKKQTNILINIYI